MREFRAVQTGKEYSGKAFSRQVQAQRSTELRGKLESFLAQERQRIKELRLPGHQEQRHVQLLEEQVRALGGTPTVWDKVKQFSARIINRSAESEKRIIEEETREGIAPQDPGVFTFTPNEKNIVDLDSIVLRQQSGRSIPSGLRNLVRVEPVYAGARILPTLEELRQDGKEVVINDDIVSLAEKLGKNPVDIFSYVYNTIQFELYSGAKKGSIGCLREKACNDVDTSSLLIALFRASGIPAHYKKSLILVPAKNLRDALGVDETRTVYVAFARQGIPIAVVEDLGTTDIDTADFSKVTNLAVEWTFVEVFVDYDERGGNGVAQQDLAGAATVEDLQKIAGSFPKKQWVPIDASLKPVIREKKEVVASQDFSPVSFIETYLRSGGTRRPIDYYDVFVQQQKGKSPFDSSYRSKVRAITRSFSILPPSLPYLLGQSASSEKIIINPEIWASLPDGRRKHVTISLKTEGGEELISKTLFGSQMNNVDLMMTYDGSTDADKAEIERSGGVHAGSPSLVAIRPALLVGGETVRGEKDVSIGDRLILRFDYGIGQKSLYSDEKFSIAGNFEGIVITLSRVQAFEYDDPEGAIKNGNTGFARAYLGKVYQSASDMAESLDHRFEIEFARAVVTQNRVLSKIDGKPTTFDFSGLTMDASALITDYNARSSYKLHQDVFRTLFGLEPSYQEAQIFTDVAGLEGVSTVKAIQYAAGKPETYSIQTITSSNAQAIDSLDYSANTKAVLKEAIGKNATIIIPSKQIEKEAWRGTVYIVLYPDMTGQYAIGEQVMSNGGYTSSRFVMATWRDDDDKSNSSYEKSANGKKYIYKDRPEKPANCLISDSVYDSIITGKSASGWSLSSYGKPCLEEGPFSFGTHDHYAVFATDGAYFKSSKDGYDSWRKYDGIESQFRQKLGSTPFVKEWVSAYWGTYAYRGIDGLGRDEKIVYSPKLSQVVRIEGNMVRQYFGSDKILGNYPPGILGFPTSVRNTVNPYAPTNTKGWYQQFTNGTMYQRSDFWTIDDVFLVPGKINEKHNQLGATGAMGFPNAQPTYSSQKDAVFQPFQNGKKIRWYPSNDVVEVYDNEPQTIKVALDFDEDEKRIFIEGFLDAFVEMGITDAYSLIANFGAGIAIDQATGVIIQKVGPKIAAKEGIKGAALIAGKYVPLAGWVLTGGTIALSATVNKPVYDACTADRESLIDGVRPPYYCGKLGAYGAAGMVGYGLSFSMNRAVASLGMKTRAAQDGKAKLLMLGTENQVNEIVTAASRNKKGLERTATVINDAKLTDGQVKEILDNPSYLSQAVNGGLLSFPRMEFAVDASDAYKKTFRLTDKGDIDELQRIKNERAGKTPKQIGDMGETYTKRFVNGNKRSFPIYDPTLGKRRNEDIFTGEGVVYEVKFHSSNVNADDFTTKQVEKDVWLRSNNEGIQRVVWVFLDKGPSVPLEELLRKNSIEFVFLTT